mgnify:FL=1|tara:strand:+ start:3673 stop:6450 length:2778 start_codon:yes stop_codon:yes gene_type:complete
MNAILRNTLVLLFTGFFLLGCGDDLTSEDHLNNANNFIKESQYEEAIIELKNALLKDDSNARARATLGTIYFDQELYADADKELSRALSAGMDPTVVVPVLAQVLVALGELDRLEALSADGLDSQSRSTLLAAKGIAKLYQQDMEEGAELIDAASESQPASNYAKVAIARLSMVRGNPEEAREQLKQVFQDDRKYAPAWILKGDIERAEGESQKAMQAYSQAINLTKNKFEPLLNRAMVRIDMGKFEGAENDLNRLQRGYKSAETHPGVQFALGLVYIQAKKINEASEAMQKASEFPKNYPESLYYLAAIHADKGQSEKALNLVNQYLLMKPENPAGSKLAARLELGKKNFQSAERLLLPVLQQDGTDVDALNLLANARLGQGKNDSGIDLLTKIVELKPKSNDAKARLGAAYLASGNEELGIETLQAILEKSPSYDNADTLIVMYYLGQEDIPSAIQAASEYTKRNPKAKSYVLLARTHLVNDDKDQAKAAFDKALELKPGDPISGISLAEYALADKDYDAARGYYQQILEHDPAHMETRMRVAATYAMEGKDKEMLDSLDATLAAYPRAMEPRLVKARYFIARGEMEKAIPLFEALSEEQREHPDALETIATFELTTSRFNQAVGTISRLIDKKPNIADYHFMKSRAYAGLGEQEKMSAELNRTLELNPAHFGAKVAVARMALLSDDTPLFEEKLTELKKVAPQSPEVIQLDVAYASKSGDNKRAKELLEGLFEREPTTGNVIALASLRQSSGNLEGAIVQLETWVDTNPEDVTARAKLAEVYGSNNQVDKVMLQCREILKLEPDNIVALNNLAWYLLESDPKESMQYAERAVALAPDSSAVLDTLALAQLENKKLDEARKTIDRALNISPKSADIRFHEAKIRAAEGDSSGAIVAITSLLNRDEDFSQRDEAEAFLEKLRSQ